MAFSDLCHISNAYKSVENESDQSERIMEENSMVRDLITKILDETGPSEGSSSIQPPEKTVNNTQNQYPKNEAGNFGTPYNGNFQNNLFNFQTEQNGFNYNLQNFGNGFNYNDTDVGLLGVDTVDASTDVTPEQLNLLRLAAQEIGGAQFTNPKFDEKFYNFFEPSQRNSMPENNMFSNNYNRPNSLNLEMNYNNFDTFNSQRFPNKFDNGFKESQESPDILTFLNQLNLLERRDEIPNTNNMEYRTEMNGHYQNEDFNKLQEQKMFFNRNFQTPPKKFNGENFFMNEMMMNERPLNQNFDFANQTPVSASNSMNFKPNGFHQDFMRNQQMPMSQPNGMNEQRNFENAGGNMQQAMMRQNQELARQMSLLMRNRPPPNQLNVDVSFLHENTPFNLGVGALLGPSPPVGGVGGVLPSPMLDLPLLAPFYAMRNMRGAATSSGILHARLDACYEQWRQLERERKRTEARLALAYPGRAVSSSNSIPVPRLPPCPSRVDRLTVDMLREHTKVLTLMGKMETLRASVCVAQNKKPNKPEDAKITVLKRGQENVSSEEKKENGLDPQTFDPTTWREDVKNLSEIAPHSEVESAMLAWRSAVAAVQAARRRELAPHTHSNNRFMRQDPIVQLAEAVKQLCICARRARCAMWCDLTLTVALAPSHSHNQHSPLENIGAASGHRHTASSSSNDASNNAKPESSPVPTVSQPASKPEIPAKNDAKQNNADSKENKTPNETKNETKPETNNNNNKTTTNKNNDNNKQQDKNQQRRTQNYRKLPRNDFYQKNQRYDNRFMHNRHPYYLATGPIN